MPGFEFSSSDKARRLGVDPSRCRAYEVSLNAWFSLGAALAVHVYACTLMRARQTSLGSAWPFSCGTTALNVVVQLESCRVAHSVRMNMRRCSSCPPKRGARAVPDFFVGARADGILQ